MLTCYFINIYVSILFSLGRYCFHNQSNYIQNPRSRAILIFRPGYAWFIMFLFIWLIIIITITVFINRLSDFTLKSCVDIVFTRSNYIQNPKSRAILIFRPWFIMFLFNNYHNDYSYLLWWYKSVEWFYT